MPLIRGKKQSENSVKISECQAETNSHYMPLFRNGRKQTTKKESSPENLEYEKPLEVVVNNPPNATAEKSNERLETVTALLDCKDDETKTENSLENLAFEKLLDVVANSPPNVSGKKNIECHEIVTGLHVQQSRL